MRIVDVSLTCTLFYRFSGVIDMLEDIMQASVPHFVVCLLLPRANDCQLSVSIPYVLQTSALVQTRRALPLFAPSQTRARTNSLSSRKNSSKVLKSERSSTVDTSTLKCLSRIAVSRAGRTR